MINPKFEIDEEVMFDNKLARINSIHIFRHNIEYQISINFSGCGKDACVVENELEPLFKEERKVKMKFISIDGRECHIIGEIMCISEHDKNCFDLKIDKDGKYLTQCFKQDIVEYIL